jgi:Xaa-Pro aminopeptidase
MTASRLERIQQVVRDTGLDALLVVHPPNIRYLTGLKASAGAAFVSRDGCVLVVDFRYATAAREIARTEPGIEVEVAGGPIEEAVGAVASRHAARTIGIEAEHLSVARFHRLQEFIGAAALEPTERLVERLRVVKDEGEIAILREAGRRISDVGRRLRELVVPGMTELEAAGFERAAFETIVASGPNGALPHARPTTRKLREGEGVVLDFGGVYDGYCVDLTRTLQLGSVSAEFRRMFGAVREAQAAAIAAVRPGARAADIDGAARRVLEARARRRRRECRDGVYHRTGRVCPRRGRCADRG